MTDIKTVRECLEHIRDSAYADSGSIKKAIRGLAALDQAMMPVDVEGLRKDVPEFKEHNMSRAMDIGWATGWNKCIDHLAATNRLNTGWMPIETAPRDDNTDILVACKCPVDGWYVQRAEYAGSRYGFVVYGTYSDDYPSIITPVYWMPLPQGPNHED